MDTLFELNQANRQIFNEKPLGRGDRQTQLGVLADVLEGLLQGANPRDQGVGQLSQGTPDLGRAAAACVRLDERHPKMAFECMHLFPDRRMSQP